MPRVPTEFHWTVECTHCTDAGAPAGIIGARLEAIVPGCIHLDLMRAGIIPDPDIGDGESAQAWVGHASWRWEARFEVSAETLAREDPVAAPQLDFVFDSIDTRARLWLNDEPLGEAANQFHPHRFEVRGLLRAGTNLLRVEIAAPVTEVRRLEALLGARPVNGDWTPYPFLRKSACNFGWDWGPRTPTSGLPGAVWLDAWRGARLAQVRPLVVACDARSATLHVHVQAVRTGRGGAPLVAEVELELPDGRRLETRAFLDGQGLACAELQVNNPPRWWPRGHGAQQLCDLRVRLGIDEPRRTRVLEQWRRRIGLRSVALETGADAHGSRFALVVNGRAVPIVGANWIPAALFPVQAPPERIDTLLELACDANLNMLRVWGGGLYESERFYERCDEFGLLVWQDFMFACATYPEDPPLPGLIEAEARFQVARLSAHPCVALWCGGNEDLLAWQSWGFKERLAPGQRWGWSYWSELLPQICREVDPTRPYWTESPFSGTLERHANDPDHGDRHTWDRKLDGYRTLIPRFTSEFGHQSPPNWQTLSEALGEEALSIGAPALAVRQRASGGDQAQYAPFLEEHFHPARDFDEWLYQTHLLQARAMRTAIAWLRANQPRSMGALFWQWNDVWSGHSWSAVDVKLRPKPMWHALRECAAPRMVSIEPLDGLRVALINDTDAAWHARLRLKRLALDGRVLAHAEERTEVQAWSVDASIALEALVGAADWSAGEFLLAEVEGRRAWWSGCTARQRPRSEGAFSVELEPTGPERWSAHIRAQGFVRELWIEPRVPWRSCAPNLLTLLPGEHARVEVVLAGTQKSPPPLRLHCAQ